VWEVSWETGWVMVLWEDEEIERWLFRRGCESTRIDWILSVFPASLLNHLNLQHSPIHQQSLQPYETWHIIK
jgi:hypothetical protein